MIKMFSKPKLFCLTKIITIVTDRGFARLQFDWLKSRPICDRVQVLKFSHIILALTLPGQLVVLNAQMDKIWRFVGKSCITILLSFISLFLELSLTLSFINLVYLFYYLGIVSSPFTFYLTVFWKYFFFLLLFLFLFSTPNALSKKSGQQMANERSF